MLETGIGTSYERQAGLYDSLAAFYPLDGSIDLLAGIGSSPALSQSGSNDDVALATDGAFTGAQVLTGHKLLAVSDDVLAPTGAFSVAAHIHCTDSGDHSYYFSLGGGRFYGRLDSDNDITCRLPLENAVSTFPIDVDGWDFADEWKHLVLTWAGDGSGTPTNAAFKMYLNGSEIFTDDYTNEPLSPSGNSASIGYANSVHLDGIIRHFGVWNGRALSADDVTLLYNGGDPLRL